MCGKCTARAVGILFDVHLLEDRSGEIEGGFPLCSQHRNVLREKVEMDWDEVDFQRFID